MTKLVVLVCLSPDDSDSQAYRNVFENDSFLLDRVELRFAKTAEAAELISDVEVATTGNLPVELLAKAPSLRWISFWSAGMDGKAKPEYFERNLLLTNASGVHGPNIAEHVMAFILMFTRGMPSYLRAQSRGEWMRDAGETELTGQTLGIVGLGRIGEALAVRAKAFDMRVIATKRSSRSRHSEAVIIDKLYPTEDLPQLLAESDHVCIALPYTPETHHLIDAKMLAQCKPTAYIYNIARGKIIDELALIDALKSGRLAGAGLDVFQTEPLPPESPLWKMENVLQTPHVSGITPHYFKRAAQLFAENVKRYLNGEPLANLYDADRGY